MSCNDSRWQWGGSCFVGSATDSALLSLRSWAPSSPWCSCSPTCSSIPRTGATRDADIQRLADERIDEITPHAADRAGDLRPRAGRPSSRSSRDAARTTDGRTRAGSAPASSSTNPAPSSPPTTSSPAADTVTVRFFDGTTAQGTVEPEAARARPRRHPRRGPAAGRHARDALAGGVRPGRPGHGHRLAVRPRRQRQPPASSAP